MRVSTATELGRALADLGWLHVRDGQGDLVSTKVEAWCAGDRAPQALDRLAAVRERLDQADGELLALLDDALATPCARDLVEMERARLRVAILFRRAAPTEADLADHVLELRHWLFVVTAPADEPRVRFYRQLSPFDPEDELGALDAFLRRLAPPLAEWVRRVVLKRPLVEAMRQTLRDRHAFGVPLPGNATPRGLRRWLAVPAGWAAPALALAALAAMGLGTTATLAGAFAVPAIAVLFTAGRPVDRLLLFMPRLGAAFAVGLLLLTMTDEMWRLALYGPPLRIAVAAALLVAFATGYLAFDLHGRGVVRPGRLAQRTGHLLLAGLAHGMLLACTAAQLVGPVFLAEVGSESGLGRASGPAMPLWGDAAAMPAQAIFFFAAGSMFVGVIVQLLWEDRAVTDRP